MSSLLRRARRLQQGSSITPRTFSIKKRKPWSSPTVQDCRFPWNKVIKTEASVNRVWSRVQLISDVSVKKKLDFEAAYFDEKEEHYSYSDDPDPDVSSIDTPIKQQLLLHGLDALGGSQMILGKGGFGIVFEANYKGQRVAAKLVCLCQRVSNSTTRSLQRERNALGLQHPHITQTLAVLQGPRYGLVIMEHLTKVTLQTLINQKSITSYQERLRYIKELCLALKYCHENGILHLDVKPLNLLLDHFGYCKLSDFGNSLTEHEFGKFGVTMGTIYYSAPEVLQSNQRPTTKADIYSLGITMWQLLSSKVPYKECKLDGMTILYKVVKFGMRPEPASLPAPESACKALVHKGYVALYQSCWHQDPLSRPSIEDTLDQVNLLGRLTAPRKASSTRH